VVSVLLTLNVGNTHTGFGIFDPQLELLYSGRCPTHPLPVTKEEVERRFLQFFESSPIPYQACEYTVVSSVVPQFTKSIEIHHPVHVLNEHSPYSFVLNTPRVGTDRLVNAEAAITRYRAPCIVVDSGTATTFSIVAPQPGVKSSFLETPEESNLAFLGGAITAGLGLSVQALIQNAAQIPSFELRDPLTVIGRNTEEALLSGSVLGHVSMIDGMLIRIKIELAKAYGVTSSPTVILTGGLGFLLHPLLKVVTHYDPHLTLRGIAYVYDRIRKRKPELLL
jgi:type III pantothenate kinase